MRDCATLVSIEITIIYLVILIGEFIGGMEVHVVNVFVQKERVMFSKCFIEQFAVCFKCTERERERKGTENEWRGQGGRSGEGEGQRARREGCEMRGRGGEGERGRRR